MHNTQALQLLSCRDPDAGAFVVDSSLLVAGPQRLEFQFTGASLRTASRTFSLPPFGKGW